MLPQNQILTLVQGADYGDGTIPGPLQIPLPTNAQYEEDDPVFLHQKYDDGTTSDAWEGVVAIVEGSPLASFSGVSPTKAGKGRWEVWHRNDNGDRWMPTSGKLMVVEAITTLPAA